MKHDFPGHKSRISFQGGFAKEMRCESLRNTEFHLNGEKHVLKNL